MEYCDGVNNRIALAFDGEGADGRALMYLAVAFDEPLQRFMGEVDKLVTHTEFLSWACEIQPYFYFTNLHKPLASKLEINRFDFGT